MNSVYCQKEHCCGCSACYNVCPTAAITMQADEEGFLYPIIDQTLCVDCTACTQACPLLQDGNFKQGSMPRFYAARHTSPKVLEQSTSGGVFTALSDAILRQEGVIYGADYNSSWQVVHNRAQTSAQRDNMRISKYVQSQLDTVYAQVKADIYSGRPVLFTGTPCQTAGLYGYLGDDATAANLYTCDLICHSIPSPLIWEEYKHLLEEEAGGRLSSVQFRSKKDGWSRANSNKGFLYTMDSQPAILEDDRFYHLFFKVGAITRPACSCCPFTDIHRAADLTIADYWGIEKYSPDWFDPLGVSVVLVNSQQGAHLFTLCQDDLVVEERPAAESLNEQPRLREPSQFPPWRSQFWQDYRQQGFKYVMKAY